MKLENVTNSTIRSTILSVVDCNCKSASVKAERIAKIVRYMDAFEEGADNGGMGKALELAIQPERSNRVDYATEEKPDRIAYINGKRCVVECKTNGGRIDNITKADFVLYGMDICNSNTKGKRRTVAVKLYNVNDFMNALQTTGSIKSVNHNGKKDGNAIQVSKIAWYEFCKNYNSLIQYKMVRLKPHYFFRSGLQ